MNTNRRRRSKMGGRKGRLSHRTNTKAATPAYITRNVPVYELASDELLDLVEANSETVLEEIGIDSKSVTIDDEGGGGSD